MEVEFDVTITAKILYNYMLHHMYTSFAGIFGTIVGLLFTANFFLQGGVIFLIGGLVILLYQPWSLFLRSRQQMAATPAFKEPLHYKMTEEGVAVSQGEEIELQSWDSMVKAISTRDCLILYTSKLNASIFPRHDLGELTPNVIEMIATHMPPNKVRIKA